MTIRVGINGFGRIGRNFWRAANAGGDRGIEIVAANDLGDIKTMAHLLKYDTLLGTLKEDVSVDGDVIKVGDKQIKILAQRRNIRAAHIGYAEHRTRSRVGLREAQEVVGQIFRQDHQVCLHVSRRQTRGRPGEQTLPHTQPLRAATADADRNEAVHHAAPARTAWNAPVPNCDLLIGP